MSDTILIGDRGAIRTLTMNRPTKLNAMNTELVDTLTAAIRAADADDHVAVVIVTGAGRAFSAGADISRDDQAPTLGRSWPARVGPVRCTSALQSTKPIVTAVHGYAPGRLQPAMSSDIAIAADDAVFGYPELKVGLAATAVAPTLVHQIGRKAAFELLTLCQNINAERALALGMINRIVPRDALVDEARRVAEQLAGFDHDALWMTKRTIQRAAAMSPLEALDMAADAALVMRIFMA
jgi:enoyl-CoA hydratase/carnithine racemase